ncbi:MAG: OmpA family protein [Acidobacteriota bacterium]
MNAKSRWIALAVCMVAMLIVTGCKNDKPTTTPPDNVTYEKPVEDVPATPTPAPAADETEMQPPPTIQELNEQLQRDGLVGDVFFAFDQFELRPDARERLARNAEFMQSAEGRDLVFTIEGHCDERGTNEYNIALGQNRSDSAVDYIVSLGVDRGRLKTISYGEERPFCTESTEGCWQKNRRARFVVTGRR